MPISAPPIDWNQAPAAFVENVGQSPKDARFVSLSMGYTLEIGENGARLVAPSQGAFALRFGGAQKKTQPVAEKPVAAKFNYYAGQTRRSNLAAYGQVRQPGVYPGIDAVWYGSQASLEYDLVVHPGADPRQIEVVAEGGQAEEQKDGSILVSRGDAKWLHHAPVAYQTVGGRRVSVAVAAQVREGRIRFEVGSYDHARDLVIDPVLEQKVDLAPRGFVNTTKIAIGADGSFAVAQVLRNFAPLFTDPSDGGDIRIAKFTATGGLLYLTVIRGDGEDSLAGVVMDAAGAVYAAGTTESKDLPSTSGAFQERRALQICGVIPPIERDCIFGKNDAFAFKLSPSGAVNWLTYLGSNHYDGAKAIAINAANQVFIAGTTTAIGFPMKNQYQRCREGQVFSGSAFLTVLNSSGSDLVYSTCIHPRFQTRSGRGSEGLAIALDPSGKAYLTGQAINGTGDDSFPVLGAGGTSPFQANTGGGIDAFVAKFDTARSGDASLVYSTLLGGASDEAGTGIVVDSQGQACVSGVTASFNFPVRAPFGSSIALNSKAGASDGFVSCLNATGSDLLFSNLYGGLNDEFGLSLTRDGVGNLWVTGSSGGAIPAVNPLENSGVGGMILKLAANTREVLLWSESLFFNDVKVTNGTVFVSGAKVETVVECASEVSSVQVTQGPIVFDAVTGRFKQTLNLAHSGPLLFTTPGTRLIFSGLPAGVQVLNASGTTSCFELGTPFLTLPLLPSIAQGGVNINVEFNPGRRTGAITYTPKITSAGVLP